MRKETRFVVVMKAFFKYTGKPLLQYKVSPVHAQIMDIFQNTMPFGLFPMKSAVTFIRHVWIANLLLKTEQVLR